MKEANDMFRAGKVEKKKKKKKIKTGKEQLEDTGLGDEEDLKKMLAEGVENEFEGGTKVEPLKDTP